MSNWGGFNKTPIGVSAGGHTVIAGRQHEQKTEQEAEVRAVTPTAESGVSGIFVPFEDKEQRIQYLQNTLSVLQNLTLSVESQLQQEMES